MGNLNISRWISLILGILLVITGVVTLFNPIVTTVAFSQAFGILLLSMGVLRLIRYFSTSFFRTGTFLIGAGLDVGLGALMFLNPAMTAAVFVGIIGFWVLFNAIVEVAISIDLKHAGFNRWWLSLILGLFGIIFGIMLVSDARLSTMYFTVLISAYLITNGITFISLFFGYSELKKFLE